MMKRKVSRVEAAIIMKSAREFRERQRNYIDSGSVITPYIPYNHERIVADVPKEKLSIFSRILNFFKKWGR